MTKACVQLLRDVAVFASLTAPLAAQVPAVVIRLDKQSKQISVERITLPPDKPVRSDGLIIWNNPVAGRDRWEPLPLLSPVTPDDRADQHSMAVVTVRGAKT